MQNLYANNYFSNLIPYIEKFKNQKVAININYCPSIIFEKLDIDTLEVLEAAGSKWNFLPFRPGLVGGHCIGVDPYYLTHKSELLGYSPEIVLAGRKINDSMSKWITDQVILEMINRDLIIKNKSSFNNEILKNYD